MNTISPAVGWVGGELFIILVGQLVIKIEMKNMQRVNHNKKKIWGHFPQIRDLRLSQSF